MVEKVHVYFQARRLGFSCTLTTEYNAGRNIEMTEEEKKKVSKAQQKAVNKYVKNNYDKILVTVPKGDREKIKAAADAVNEPVNTYIKTAISRRMESGT